MNTITIGLCAAGLVCYAAILISIPVRTKKLRQNAGEQCLALKNTSGAKWILIALFAAAIICVLPFRDMGFFVDAVMIGAALIATELASREAANRGMAGVYREAIVVGTQIVYFKNIESLPTLAYENDPDSDGDYKTSLKIIQRDGKEIMLVFADEEDRANAVETLLELMPGLKG